MTTDDVTVAVRDVVRAELSNHVPPRLLSPEAAGRALGLATSAVYKLLREGRLRSFKEGRRRLIPVAALDEYVADREAEQGVA